MEAYINIALIFIVIVAFSVFVANRVKKNRESIEEKDINVDDKTYTLEMMIQFIKKRLDEITKINLYDIGLSEEELERRKQKKYELKKALKGCTYGDVNDKKYVKELIFDLLFKEYGVNVHVVDPIAEKLEVYPSTVTKMLKKLDAEGYIVYEKYRGIALTDIGKKMGEYALTRHELLEEFLHIIVTSNEISRIMDGIIARIK